MPKRVPTPPPADDEPKYLTVCNPYPGAPNMELLGDRKAFVFWLACCTGKDPLVAFFYKPKTQARLPPVGSEAWAVAKESGTLTSSAWAKGPPNSKAKNARPSVSPTLKISSTFAAGPPRLDTNGWRGPSLPNIYAPIPGSAIPPGLSRLETNVSEGSSNSPGWEIPPILSRGPSAIGSSGSSDVDSIRATPIAPESPDIQIAGEGFEEAMSGLGVYDEDEDDLWNIGVSVNVAIAPNAEETLPNLWEDYGKKEPEIPKEDIVCRVHGKICPKGICKQRKSQEKELEKKKREAERAQDGKKKKDKPWRVASDTDNNGGEQKHA
ncbi:hypothetical protein EW026_g6883 [Hermanssonia centrifuga]|uniref:Uncharacterized protein n=1 Tax=Hermanssonia centrifuga TaxID=98765 RepID=A0A4S4KAK7_9APHY|nr:hypothetical protein EW026_g6883 [Hermanssonia centrifuga]